MAARIFNPIFACERSNPLQTEIPSSFLISTVSRSTGRAVEAKAAHMMAPLVFVVFGCVLKKSLKLSLLTLCCFDFKSLMSRLMEAVVGVTGLMSFMMRKRGREVRGNKDER